MSLPLRLQFRLLPPEAQEAALRRLALSGFDPTMISAQTGVPENEVRRYVAPPPSSAPGADSIGANIMPVRGGVAVSDRFYRQAAR